MTALPMRVAPRRRHQMQGDTILDCIGNTPLVRLQHVTRDLAPGVAVYAKAEFVNPGGSVKDRPALAMIQDGLRRGELRPGKVIMDATSGNTGIALAMIGAALGYPVELVLPANVSEERKGILRAYGATLILTDPLDGINGAILESRRRRAENPDHYFMPDQYNNPANWRSHYTTTGPEIWRQTGGQVTHFVAGIGTSGTLMGVGRYLRRLNPVIKLYSVEPADELETIEGLKYMAGSIVPGIYDSTLPDEHLYVQAREAYAMALRLAREEGLFVGFSAGANVVAALRVAQTLEQGTVVTILPDGGEKYLSLIHEP